MQVAENHNQVYDAGADRISNLPPIITERILECLPLEDAMRMSILSRYWRYQWTLIPQLILDRHFMFPVLPWHLTCRMSDHDYLVAYLNTVNNVLLRHIAPIRKFVLYIPSRVPVSVDITQWMRFLAAKGVKEFTLYTHQSEKMKIPSILFSFSGLTHLELLNCYIYSLPPTFSGFPCLISLHLDCDDGSILPKLISHCPQLESLSLNLFDVDINTDIYAPKLRDLLLRGSIFNIYFKGTTKLSTLSLEAKWGSITELEKFLFCLPNAPEKLVLSGSFWQIGHPKVMPKVPIHELGRLTTLKLVKMPVNCRWAIALTLSIFGNSPHLQQLEIEVASTYWYKCKCCGDMLFEIKEDCSLQHLKKVAFVCISGSYSDLELIKLLLARSPVLQVMTIELNRKMQRAEEKLNITRKLLRYPRLSKNAEIIFKS